MNVIEVKNYEEMSRIAAQHIIKKIRAHRSYKLGLATGSTPKGVYHYLVKDHQETQTSYQQIKTFNLDEYVGISAHDSNSYHYFMREHLFNHIDIPAEHTYIPSGVSTNLEKECLHYEEKIRLHGGVDLQLLGIGQNGHIGFNEPGTSFKSRTHIVPLTESTRKANARFFPSIEEVPTHAITVGIGTILDSKEILLLASGKAKAEAISRLLNGDLDEEFPASSLLTHKHVTVIADEEALSLTKEYFR
ncbi:glucosamine-6-phosphate deaminase [Bacillus sp. 31A1R]|uniref:Glucosamine-6-phosphate deaminase n=1 Tax=Robertmurraya mangrovi TaxID=3098077 RepID=A0ABU5J3X0_9BACI|nr:glucosamine-6-phosphate deaminase [Bacillus sp. 31A1R]MDZ5474125.1 glucosamine-6-phosphate deaminase [Bacillus sp. 31A1R]